MSLLKRKRAHEGATAIEPASQATTSKSSAVTRRATRQTSIAPLPIQPDPEPRRRRRRKDSDSEPQPEPAPEPEPPIAFPVRKRGGGRHAPDKENIPVDPPPNTTAPMKVTRHTRRRSSLDPLVAGHVSGVGHASGSSGATKKAEGLHAGAGTSGGGVFAPVAAVRGASSGRSAAGSAAPPAKPQHNIPKQRRTSRLENPDSMASTATAAETSQNSGSVPATTQQHRKDSSGSAQKTPAQLPNDVPEQPQAQPRTDRPDRNIDKVVLGNICFSTWYPSYLGNGKDLSTLLSGSSSKSGEGSKNGRGGAQVNGGSKGSKDENTGGKAQGRREREKTPVLAKLFVCPCCFKYSKELIPWHNHVRLCEQEGLVPGHKIYVHPKGRRTVQVPSSVSPKNPRGKRGSVGSKMIEEEVQDQGEWSIWEVDGEKDVLFCQNLSLFAKLFLDNKSVFFDVTGFNYFLLVYTPPPPSAEGTSNQTETRPTRSQIVGFFSKEKMSWDNNNLACILVFPPWQRKGLGPLLMGISYEISRREGVLGGPEKPISDLGKKGYKRFWSGEVARWILDMDLDGETVVDVEECSKATWIAPEDCLLVLREMGVAEDAGKGPSRKRARHAVEEEEEQEANSDDTEEVQRVRIDMKAVRQWVQKNGISLEPACDPNGFVEGYAVKEVDMGEEDEEE